MDIEPALSGDATVLTAIAFAAKQHWGYPQKWMESWRTVLTIQPEFIVSHETYKANRGDRVAGFYALAGEGVEMDLLHLWVLPQAMGCGVGRSLFLHCLGRARELGCKKLRIESDPNAESFYQHMGAQRVGSTFQELDGQRRELPLLVSEVDSA
jgi:GNAT superfamily N-acetyltransferase